MPTTILTITHSESAAQMSDMLDRDNKHEQATAIAQYLESLKSGFRQGTIDVQVAEGDAVAASVGVTEMDIPAIGDTLVINGVAFTAVAADPGDEEFLIGDFGENNANIAAAINASNQTMVSDYVTATVGEDGTLILTAIRKGIDGNAMRIDATGSWYNLPTAASTAYFSGGTNATPNTHTFG
jgi:hypothetical protein